MSAVHAGMASPWQLAVEQTWIDPQAGTTVILLQRGCIATMEMPIVI